MLDCSKTAVIVCHVQVLNQQFFNIFSDNQEALCRISACVQCKRRHVFEIPWGYRIKAIETLCDARSGGSWLSSLGAAKDAEDGSVRQNMMPRRLRARPTRERKKGRVTLEGGGGGGILRIHWFALNQTKSKFLGVFVALQLSKWSGNLQGRDSLRTHHAHPRLGAFSANMRCEMPMHAPGPLDQGRSGQ